MATKNITLLGIGIRFLIALMLVFASYNPEGYSYINWIVKPDSGALALKIFIGIVLVIGWTVYLRATFSSLGGFGISLTIAFFAVLLWLLTSWGWLSAGSYRAVAYMVLFVIAALMATGMSWSHIRRRTSGQVDVDEIEDR